MSALIGTAPTTKDPAVLFVWTDTGFSETEGDLISDDIIVSLCVTDLTNDGQLNFFNVSAFLNAFAAGCP